MVALTPLVRMTPTKVLILHYFKDIKSRGELARLLFAFYDIPYEQELLDLTAWTAEKKSTYPFRVLPCLELAEMENEVDENTRENHVYFSEIAAIAHYIAELGGYGKTHDARTRLQVHEVTSAIIHFMDKYVNQFSQRFIPIVTQGIALNTELNAQEQAFFTHTLYPFFQCLEDRLQNDTSCFVGKSDGLPEIMAFWIYDLVQISYGPFFDTSNLTRLHTMVERLRQNKRLAAYLESRPNALPF